MGKGEWGVFERRGREDYAKSAEGEKNKYKILKTHLKIGSSFYLPFGFFVFFCALCVTFAPSAFKKFFCLQC